jgi:aryl-alcohol dehydrogenase-like predicted oxidoreductase
MGPCPDAIVNAKAPLTRRGCDNTVCLRAWEQTTGSTHWGEQEPQGGPKMAKLDASKSGTFKIGGEIEINRLGFGAMRITGKGIWGEPEDRPEALRTLKRVPELGIDFIDTADSYGPDVSEELIHEALFPYEEMLIATKAGFQRTGPGVWKMDGRPEWLRSQALSSCKRLGVKRIDLWQLHRIDPKVPRHAQFAAIKSMIDDGIIRFAGLSEVSVADIEEASEVFPVVSVQNRYNLVDRGSEDVLDYCEANGIGFIPWYPLAAGDLAKEGSILDRIAKKHGAAPSQIALACVLKRSPVMLPIPGTSKVKHLEENVAAVNIELTDDEFALLDREGRTASQAA